MSQSTASPGGKEFSHCAECGMVTRDAGEFHPYAFCALRKAGLDPWREIRIIALQLGLDDPGERPPLITRIVSTPPGEQLT